MIEGVKFDIKGEDLVTHYQKRMAYHLEREEFYLKEAERFKHEAQEQLQAAATYSNTKAISTYDGLKASGAYHADRKRFFSFAAAYTVKTETYRFAQVDAATMELIPTRGY